MGAIQFQKATRTQIKLRMALCGPTGSGKSFTALRVGMHLPGPLAAIDTERRSLSKYVGVEMPGDPPFAFDVLELTESQSPAAYIAAIHAAAEAGYGTLVIDSLSHAWIGTDGALEQVDRAAKKSQSGNSFTAWRDITPQHNALVKALLECPMHLIVTMRSKMEYVLEDDGRGKKTPRKVGMAPEQRAGVEYEFDVVGDLTLDHELLITKSRAHALADKTFRHPGRDLAKALTTWLELGERAAPAAAEAKDASGPTNAPGLALVEDVANATTRAMCRDAYAAVNEAARERMISRTLAEALRAKLKSKAATLPPDDAPSPLAGAPPAGDEWGDGRL